MCLWSKVKSQMKTIIDIEGFDRVGKDTLLSGLIKAFPNLQLYRQPTSESTGVNYRDSVKFSDFLRKHYKRMISDLAKLPSENPIILSRFLVSDAVYSSMFGRENLLEQEFEKSKLFGKVRIIPVILYWANYEEYLKRVNSDPDSIIEYTASEFNEIQNKFINSAGKDAIVILVNEADSRQDILNRTIKQLKEANAI